MMVRESFQNGEAHARVSDPSTSHAAANSMRGQSATELELLVLNKLRRMGDATSEEVADSIGISLQSISPRFAPLARKGLIEKTGETREGSSGRNRQVWRVT
jgi:predicted transcriptional regulator